MEFPGNTSQDMSVQGTAEWKATGTIGMILLYEEEGLMTPTQSPIISSPPVSVRASHEWKFVEDVSTRESGAEVFFYPEGRHFYSLSCAGDGPALFQHHCTPDTYSGSFRLENEGARLFFEWQVEGPQKNYRIFTSYEKT